ncbi:MAG: 16S rRNA processing protein RimM [Paludibacteraceae bacterium]|nr:16S rRNA processing protein RimM [Paludibacteraceae bacterium]
MITRDDIMQVGQIVKTHGLRGELAFTIKSDLLDEVDPPCLICELDGIYVPFFIEELRFKNDETALVKFEGIDSAEEAQEMVKCGLYIEKKYVPEEIGQSEVEGVDYYIGFKIFDSEGKEIGVIDGVDDSSENVLFLVVSPKGEEYYIPATDEYIIEIDDEKRTMSMDLPEGLLDLYK